MALVLCLSLCTVTAFADGITTWAGLQAAIDAAAASPTTITLTQDLKAGTADNAITISSGKNITLDLNGHTLDRGLKDCAAADYGYVISVMGSTLTLTDSSAGKTGKITGGNNKGDGGGVVVSGGSTFNMKGGSITGNTSTSLGISAVENFGTFTMTGGEITGNMADNYGAVYTENGGTTTLGGTAKITGNTDLVGTTACNVVVDGTNEVTIGTGENAPQEGMNIAVTGSAKPFTTNGTATDVAYFHSDDPNRKVVFNTDYLELKEKDHTIAVDPAVSNGTIITSQTKADNGDNITVTVTPANGYKFKEGSLKVTKTGETEVVSVSNNSFTMPAYDVTVTAEFEKKSTGGGSAAPIVTSPKTGDMGIALYGVLSAASLMGMGWVSKKKH